MTRRRGPQAASQRGQNGEWNRRNNCSRSTIERNDMYHSSWRNDSVVWYCI